MTKGCLGDNSQCFLLALIVVCIKTRLSVNAGGLVAFLVKISESLIYGVCAA